MLVHTFNPSNQEELCEFHASQSYMVRPLSKTRKKADKPNKKKAKLGLRAWPTTRVLALACLKLQVMCLHFIKQTEKQKNKDVYMRS